LFLAPLVILTATCLQLVQSHYSILRIATYIRVCIEGKADEPKKLETCIGKLRNKESEARTVPETTFSIMLHVLIATAAGMFSILLACGYAYLNYQANGFQHRQLIGLLISTVALGCWIWFSYKVFRKLKMATLLEHEKEFAKDLSVWVNDKEHQ